MWAEVGEEWGREAMMTNDDKVGLVDENNRQPNMYTFRKVS